MQYYIFFYGNTYFIYVGLLLVCMKEVVSKKMSNSVDAIHFSHGKLYVGNSSNPDEGRKAAFGLA